MICKKKAVATQDGLGWIELYCPDSPKVDICFVHGLKGGQLSTWSSVTDCWPRDLLSKDTPDVRILAFGYEAEVFQFWTKVSQNTFKDHACNLLESLGNNRIKVVAVSDLSRLCWAARRNTLTIS